MISMTCQDLDAATNQLSTYIVSGILLPNSIQKFMICSHHFI